eukprot:11230391-Alexandrium_andersonii.AAC.1
MFRDREPHTHTHPPSARPCARACFALSDYSHNCITCRSVQRSPPPSHPFGGAGARPPVDGRSLISPPIQSEG